MEAAIEQATQRPKRKHGRKALWLGLFIVLAVVGGRWLWRQVQFSRLRAPLIRAVRDNNFNEARALLEQGADPNVRLDYIPEPWTWTTLWQMLRGKTKGVGLPMERTVLMEAAALNKVEIVRLLLKHGADTEQRNYGDTQSDALHYATTSDARASMRALLKHSAQVDAKDGNGNTALMLAISTDAYSKSENSERSCVPLLLEFGAHVNAQNANGKTPLMLAAGYSRSPSIPLLLQQGADPNLRDTAGNTALMFAIRQTDQAEIEALLKAGANIDAQNMAGKTPLMDAIAHARYEEEGGLVSWRKARLKLIHRLLDGGADVTLKDGEGKTALQQAASYHLTDIVPLLRKAAARASGAGKGAGY